MFYIELAFILNWFFFNFYVFLLVFLFLFFLILLVLVSLWKLGGGWLVKRFEFFSSKISEKRKLIVEFKSPNTILKTENKSHRE